MNEEVLRVLKMVEEGKITADKAKDLIDALNNSNRTNDSDAQIVISENKNYEDKFLRIKVLRAEGDKVNVQLPIKIIREVLKVTGKLPIKTEGLDGVDIEQLMNTIVTCLDNEAMGEIVDVTSNKGDIEKVVIE